jgi:hypothetical protein
MRCMVAVLLALALCGCSPSDVSGTYQHEQDSRKLLLTKTHKLVLLDTGDNADYTIEGNSIIVTSPIFGGATREVKGKTLVFPAVISKGLFDVSEVAKSLQGTWTRQR